MSVQDTRPAWPIRYPRTGPRRFVIAGGSAADVGAGVLLDATGRLPVTVMPPGIVGALTYKGTIDASLNPPYPPGPAVGDYWRITASGTVGGATVNAGDAIIWNGVTWDIVPDFQETDQTYNNSTVPGTTATDALNLLYAGVKSVNTIELDLTYGDDDTGEISNPYRKFKTWMGTNGLGDTNGAYKAVKDAGYGAADMVRVTFGIGTWTEDNEVDLTCKLEWATLSDALGLEATYVGTKLTGGLTIKTGSSLSMGNIAYKAASGKTLTVEAGATFSQYDSNVSFSSGSDLVVSGTMNILGNTKFSAAGLTAGTYNAGSTVIVTGPAYYREDGNITTRDGDVHYIFMPTADCDPTGKFSTYGSSYYSFNDPGGVIKNLDDPIEPQDAVNLRTLDTHNVIVAATDYYVDPVSGDDSNDGLIGNPWKTLTKVTSFFDDKYIVDVEVNVYCAAGTYTEAMDPTLFHWRYPTVKKSGSGVFRMIFDERLYAGFTFAHEGDLSSTTFLTFNAEGDVNLAAPGAQSITVTMVASEADPTPQPPQIATDGWGSGDFALIQVNEVVYVAPISSVVDTDGSFLSTLNFAATGWTDYQGNPVATPDLTTLSFGTPDRADSITLMPDRSLVCGDARTNNVSIPDGAEYVSIRGLLIDKRTFRDTASNYAVRDESRTESPTAVEFTYDAAQGYKNMLVLCSTDGGIASTYGFFSGDPATGKTFIGCSVFDGRAAIAVGNESQNYVYGCFGFNGQFYGVSINNGSIRSCTAVSVLRGFYVTGAPSIYLCGAYRCTQYGFAGNYAERLRLFAIRAVDCAYGVHASDTGTTELSSANGALIIKGSTTAAIWADKGRVNLRGYSGKTFLVEVPTNKIGIDVSNAVTSCEVYPGSGPYITITKEGGATGTIGITASNGAQAFMVGAVITTDTPVDADVDNRYGNNLAYVLTTATETINVPDPVDPLNVVNLQTLDSHKVITTDTNLYVDPDAGSDTNDGLTLGTAWKTLNYASRFIEQLYIEADAKVTVICKTGTTYTEDYGTYLTVLVGWLLPVNTSPGSIEFIFDDRDLAGTSLMHDQNMKYSVATIDSSPQGLGERAVLSSSGANNITLTITGETQAPDFSSYVSGDKVLVHLNGGNYYIGTLSAAVGGALTFATGQWTDYAGGAVSDPTLSGIGQLEDYIVFLPDTTFKTDPATTSMIRFNQTARVSIKGLIVDHRDHTAVSYGSYLSNCGGSSQRFLQNVAMLSSESETFVGYYANHATAYTWKISTIKAKYGIYATNYADLVAMLCLNDSTGGVSTVRANYSSRVQLIACNGLNSTYGWYPSIGSQMTITYSLMVTTSKCRCDLFSYMDINVRTRIISSSSGEALLVSGGSFLGTYNSDSTYRSEIQNTGGGNCLLLRNGANAWLRRLLDMYVATGATAIHAEYNSFYYNDDAYTDTVRILKLGGATGTYGGYAENSSIVNLSLTDNQADNPAASNIDDKYGNNYSVVLSNDNDTINVSDPVDPLNVVNLQTLDSYGMVIASDLTLYVDPDAGDDANDGLTLGTAWKTLDHASRWLETQKILKSANVTVSCKSGTTYAEKFSSAIHWKLPSVDPSSGIVKFVFDTRPSVGQSVAHAMLKASNTTIVNEPDNWGKGECALSTPGANQIQVTWSGSGAVAATLNSEFVAGDTIFVGILDDSFQGYGVVQSVTADTITFVSGSWMARDWTSIGDPSLTNINTPGAMISLLPDTIFDAPDTDAKIVLQGETVNNLTVQGIHLKGYTNTNFSVNLISSNDEADIIDEYSGVYDFFTGQPILRNIFLSFTASGTLQYAVYLTSSVVNVSRCSTNGSYGFKSSENNRFYHLAGYCTKKAFSAISSLLNECIGISSSDNSHIINRDSNTQVFRGLSVAKSKPNFDIDGVSGLFLSDMRVYNRGAYNALWIYRGSTVFLDEATRGSIYESAGADVIKIDQSLVYFDPITINVPTNKKGILAQRLAQVFTLGMTIQPIGGATGTIGIDANTGAHVIATAPTITCATDVVAAVKDQFGQEQAIVNRNAINTLQVPDPVNPLNVVNKQYVDQFPSVKLNHGIDKDAIPVLSYSGGNIVLTGTFTFWVNGVKYTKTNDSIALPGSPVTGAIYYVKYSAGGNLSVSSSVWNFLTDVPVCYVKANSTGTGYITDVGGSDPEIWYELHTVMDAAVHVKQHFDRGTIWKNGLATTRIGDGAGDTNDDMQANTDPGTIIDENIEITTTDGTGSLWAQELTPMQAPIYYRTGSNGYWVKVAATTYVVHPSGGTYPTYNQWTGATWQLTELAAEKFMIMWLCKSSQQTEPLFLVMGQAQYDSEAEANDVSLTDIDLSGLEIQELSPIGKYVVQTSAAYTNAYKAAIRATYSLRGLAGGINVSSAINEHNAMGGRTVPDTHPASSITNTSTVTGATVENALDTLKGAAGGNSFDQEANCIVTSSDGDKATNMTLTSTPALNGYVQVFMNGIRYHVNGDKLGKCYFSGDGGTTARAKNAAQAGDTLHWNGSVATFELLATDIIAFVYNI